MRETVVYVLLFVLIVGAGAVLIVPRLLRDAPEDVTDVDDPLGAGTAPDDTSDPELVDVAGPRGVARPLIPLKQLTLPEGVEVLVTGVGGPLSGPLKAPVGATLGEPIREDDREPRIRLDATDTRIAFGAFGHQWVEVPVGDLVDGLHVQLPRAAPPIVVRVREPDGSPAAGVPATVRPASPVGAPRTDGGGTLVIDDAAPGLVLVDLTTNERAGPRLRLRAGVDRDVEAVLEPAWTVTGRVVDPDGNPVGGARIDTFAPAGPLGRTTVTYADGRFTWRGRATVAAAFRVRTDRFAELAVEASPPCIGALATDLGDLTLTELGVSIECAVDSSVPVGGAYVEVEPQAAAIVRELFGTAAVLDRPRRETLDEDGRVRFDGLPARVPLRVTVRGAGVRTDAIVDADAGETHRLTFEPTPGHVLAGFVRAPDGKPLSGVRVLASRDPRDGDQAALDDQVFVTGAQGAFQAFGLSSTVVYLRAYVPGYRSLLRRVRLPLAEPLDLTLEAALADEERRVEGVVVDERGTPLPGVTVRAAGVRTTTGADGRFRLDGVESLAPVVAVAFGFDPGPLPVDAPDPRPFVTGAVFELTPGTGRQVELVLPDSAVLSMSPVDGIDGTPLSFVHLLVRSDRGRRLVDRGVAPINGRIDIAGLPARDDPVTLPRQTLEDGTTRVVAQPSVQVRASLVADKRRADVYARVDNRVASFGSVWLPHGMRITGRVVDKAGKPIPGARIAGMDDGWQSRGTDPLVEREALFRLASTDAEGRFVLEGFDPKRPADLAVWADGRAPVGTRVLLPAFSDVLEADIEVTLDVGGYVLLLLEEKGTKHPIDGALMDLEHGRDGSDYLDLLRAGVFGGLLGSTAEWKAASEHVLFADRERGAYAIGPVQPGPYEIWVEHPLYEPVRRKITVFGKGENVFDPYAHTSRTVQGEQTRMILLMQPR